MRVGGWRLGKRGKDTTEGDATKSQQTTKYCVHIRLRQLMDHLLFGGVSRVLWWMRRRRRRGTGPISVGLAHYLLTGQSRCGEGKE